ncbi:MAG: hypothetical protein IT371_30080 [Deltaproteobacteria bacterium]|nr:hypothetical protein [Deltaproteobacteria bacterium]
MVQSRHVGAVTAPGYEAKHPGPGRTSTAEVARLARQSLKAPPPREDSVPQTGGTIPIPGADGVPPVAPALPAGIAPPPLPMGLLPPAHPRNATTTGATIPATSASTRAARRIARLVERAHERLRRLELHARARGLRARWMGLPRRTRWAAGVGAGVSLAIFSVALGLALRGSTAQANTTPLVLVPQSSAAADDGETRSPTPRSGRALRAIAPGPALGSHVGQRVPESPQQALETSAEEDRALRQPRPRAPVAPKGVRIRYDRARDVVEIYLPDGAETQVELKRDPQPKSRAKAGKRPTRPRR